MKYSVIIPVYNSESYILKTLESIKEQSFKDFEIVIINDGSTDKSEDVILKFKKDNPDINLFYKKINNSGPSTARNIGLKEAKGDFVCFLDSDDQYDIHLFEEINPLIDKETDVIYFGWVDKKENGEEISHYDKELGFKFIDNLSGNEAVKKKYLKEIWLCNCNEIYRREMLNKNGLSYLPGVFAGEDMNFIYKALMNSRKVRVLNKNYFYCTLRESSLMHHSFSNKHITEFVAINDLLDYSKNNEEVYPYIYSLSYYTQITVAKKIVKSLGFWHPFKFRKLVKINIPKVKKIKGMILNRKQKLECTFYRFSKVLFFYFVKLYFGITKKA